ncbi:AMP-binding protein [Curvibacter sp. CHRR-16]|nr:AMP-binding protein [Curvibacter sp. CHRR-16]
MLDHTVIAPLPQWAQTQAQRPALSDGLHSLSFAELWQAVQARSAALPSALPSSVLVAQNDSPLEQLLDFLALQASGRCAAIGHPDWTEATHQQVRQALANLPSAPTPLPAAEQGFYIGFTSGSTGVPKGFRRSHRSWTESLRVCVDTFGPAVCGPVLAPGSIAHSLFLFGMVLGLWTGGGVVVQDRFNAGRALDTLAQGHATCLVAVPSQLLLMLEWAQHRHIAPIASTQLILISGARWSRQHTAAVKALFPHARIVEFYGASEASFITWQDADATTPFEVVGQPFSNVRLRIENGLIYVHSPMLFSDYVLGAGDQTAAHYATFDGVEWLTIRDMGRIDEQGRLCLAGREHRMIVTQGKNLFPDELEALLGSHPAVANASVHGVPDALRGQAVVAVLRLHAHNATQANTTLTSPALVAWCRQWLEGWKVPRQFVLCNDWPLTASGKTNHARLGELLLRQDPCLRPLL